MEKKAFFRFEASPSIGAGHAIRSCVVADALHEDGWSCFLVTSKESCDFIADLKKFKRIDPQDFYEKPIAHDLLVIDHYDLDETYETYFRPYAHQIMVIDDLANRKHNCDILLDQTYGRQSEDYKNLVPESCKILTGSDYILLRKEFLELRPLAIEKRKATKKIETILISMGGSDPKNYTLKALNALKDSGFKGHIDVVLGFQSVHHKTIQAKLKDMKNSFCIHVNPNMAQLTYKADLCIGASGSSVWERCCLGLPSILMVTADNQKKIYKNLIDHKIIYSKKKLISLIQDFKYENNGLSISKFNGIFRLKRLLNYVGS